MSKRIFTHIPLGPWPAGMVNTTREDRIPPSGLVEALNVNVRRDGSVYSRPKWIQAFGGESAHDLFTHGGRDFCVLGGDLVELDSDGATTLMPSVGRINWTILNDAPVFCSRNLDSVFQVVGSGVEQISGVDEDEFDMDDVLVPLPGGHWIEYWNGRLLVARGRSLLFSQPLRYGAHNPMSDYILFPTKIEWVAPLETGIYVGLRGQVRFFAGSTLAELSQTQVATRSAPGMALTVSSEFISQEVAVAPRVAVFFTSSGFTVGLPDGRVVYPQNEALRDLPLFRGKLVQDGSRIFAVRGI